MKHGTNIQNKKNPVKFDESRYKLMSDLNWVTDVETDISIKSGAV